MKANYLKSLSTGSCRTMGQIGTAEQYESLKAGEIDWKDYQKKIMKSVEIPVDLFYRLMKLDMDMTKCTMPDGIEVRPDGEHELDPCCYKVKEIHRNVTVTISECKKCGSVDISWERQEDTEDEYLEE